MEDILWKNELLSLLKKDFQEDNAEAFENSLEKYTNSKRIDDIKLSKTLSGCLLAAIASHKLKVAEHLVNGYPTLLLSRSKYGNIPLGIAVLCLKEDDEHFKLFLKILDKTKAECRDITNNNGYSAVHLSIIKRKPKMLEALLPKVNNYVTGSRLYKRSILDLCVNLDLDRAQSRIEIDEVKVILNLHKKGKIDLNKIINHQELFIGNFLSRVSIILYAATTYGKCSLKNNNKDILELLKLIRQDIIPISDTNMFFGHIIIKNYLRFIMKYDLTYIATFSVIERFIKIKENMEKIFKLGVDPTNPIDILNQDCPLEQEIIDEIQCIIDKINEKNKLSTHIGEIEVEKISRPDCSVIKL